MSTPRSSLALKHADLTQTLILDSAVELLETASVVDLSVRAVAKNADISERTIFRYFASRDDLLDAVALEISRRLDAPPNPETVEQLIAYPAAMFARFEATSALTRAALHSELYHRIRARDALGRGVAIRALLDRVASGRSERERHLAAANIHYHVIASTWRYYRDYFRFSLDDAVECASMAIIESLRGLGVAHRRNEGPAAGAGAEQIPADRQPQDRQGPRPHHSADPNRPRQRGYRHRHRRRD